VRIGALLELDGTAVEVVRRKGRKNTLADPGGGVLDAALLDRALGGLSAEVFSGLFEITHDSLVDGGHELLAGRGAVGESLFAAAAGTSRLHALLRRLEDDAHAVFTPLGRKKELNVLLSQYAEAARVLRDAALRPPRHEALTRELEALETAYAAAGDALDAVERERSRLERLRGALPLAGLRAQRLHELAALGEVAVLATDAPARRGAALRRAEAGRTLAAATARDLERRRARVTDLAVDEPLLPFADELEGLHADGTAVVRDATRREELAAQAAALEPRLQELLVELAPALGEGMRELAGTGESVRGGADPAAADDQAARSARLRELVLDNSARTRLETCLQARAGVRQAAGTASAAVVEARRVAKRAAATVARTPAVTDDTRLAATLRAARSAGPVDEAVARARAEERSAHAQAERATAQLHPAPASAADLATLPVPDPAIVEQRLSALLEAEQIATGLEAEAEGIAERSHALEHQRAALRSDAPVLDAAALQAARATREQTWDAVREALTEPVSASKAAGLAAAHQRAIAEADAIADTRLQRAEDVARLADVERELEVLARDREELEHRRQQHATVGTQAAAAWSAAWEPTEPYAPSPATAGAWLASRDAVLGHLQVAAEAAERAEAAEAMWMQHAAALADALAATEPDTTADAPTAGDSINNAAQATGDGDGDGDGSSAPLPLATLLELADARLDTLRDRAEQAGRAADAHARAIVELEDAQAALVRTEAQAADWETEWAALRSGCGLADTLEPDGALSALRALEQAARNHERLDELRAEVAAIDARRGAFEAALRRLVDAVAPDLAEHPATTAATLLHRRATEARAAAAERTALTTELTELEAERGEATAMVAEAEQELAELRATAGAEDDDDLIRREQDSARAAELRTEIATLDGDLARAGGAAADEVAAAVAALDPDAVPARAEELKALASHRRAERDEAGTALTRARDELARLERSEEAAQAAQDIATLEAQVRELAERYARSRLAQRVLRNAIARYRSEHEGPLLARANALFPALTCERFSRLETDVDERDEDVLIAVTADGSRRRVHELSDGTREQLFLALRLAAIERHVATAEAVPVLFDDVLLESDDERAAQIVVALADLATQTQVIVLTHHRHLVEIAAATLPADRLDVIELSAGAADPIDDPRQDDDALEGHDLREGGDEPLPEPLADEPALTPTLAAELEAVVTSTAGTPPVAGEQQQLL
jgi:uncharacterized protein YhaN